MFSGYWNRPDDTRETLVDGGWLRTGDIVKMDADGFITIVDRIKELIISGGFNIAPSEVEAVLLSHPPIADAAVVGLPSPRGGEKVVAAVVLKPAAKLDADAIRSHARSRLAAYKVPASIVEVDELGSHSSARCCDGRFGRSWGGGLERSQFLLPHWKLLARHGTLRGCRVNRVGKDRVPSGD